MVYCSQETQDINRIGPILKRYFYLPFPPILTLNWYLNDEWYLLLLFSGLDLAKACWVGGLGVGVAWVGG